MTQHKLSRRERISLAKRQRAQHNRRDKSLRRVDVDLDMLRAGRQIIRRHRDWLVAIRLCKRFYRETMAPPAGDIREDLRYWHLRKFGYDVLSEELRTVGFTADHSPILIDPRDTLEWRWWTEIMDEGRRRMLLEKYPQRLIAAAVDASNALHKFERRQERRI